MKNLLLILFCLIAVTAGAQYIPNSGSYAWPGGMFLKSLQIPTGCGQPVTSVNAPDNKRSAVYYDSCNASFYRFDPKTQSWTAASGHGVDSIFITHSDSIFIISGPDTIYVGNAKNAMDTAYQRNDTLYGVKGGTEFFIAKNPLYTASTGIVLQGNNFKLQDTLNGPGTKFQFFAGKGGALRVGNVNGGQWNIDSIGFTSYVFGTNSVATGSGFVLGNNSKNYGNACAIIGANNIVSLNTAGSIFGNSSYVAPNAAGGPIIIGQRDTSYGITSYALGIGLKAKNYQETVLGSWNDSTSSVNNVWASTNRAFEIGIGQNDISRANGLTMFGSGKLQLNKYGLGTFTGTPAFGLSVDAGGNIIETANSGGAGWSLTGNSITAGSNFLGTTNNTSLRFITNNTQKMVIDSIGNLTLNGNQTVNNYIIYKNNGGYVGYVEKANTVNGIINQHDLAMENGTQGDVVLYNDNTSGSIRMGIASLGSSLMSINPTGAVGVYYGMNIGGGSDLSTINGSARLKITGTNYYPISFTDGVATLETFINNTNSNAAVQIYTATNHKLGLSANGAIPFLVLHPSSNVTIGSVTDNANGTLQVTGNLTMEAAGNTLKLATGTTSAAPMNIPAGVFRTVPASGDIESNGNNLRWTNAAGTPVKLINYKRIQALTTASTVTPDADNNDAIKISALTGGTLTINAPSGTPAPMQELLFRITDNGTAQSLTWNSVYRASPDLPLPVNTIAGKTMYLKFYYNSDSNTWDFVSLLNNF